MPIIGDNTGANALIQKLLNPRAYSDRDSLEFIFRSGNWEGWNEFDYINRQDSVMSSPSESRLNQYFFKSYPPYSSISLPRARDARIPESVESIFLNRRAQRNFSSAPIHLDEISNILRLGNGLKPGGKTESRTLGSGGARFPLEMYLVAKRVVGLESGVYHYNVSNLGLEHLPCAVEPVLKSILGTGTERPNPACLIVATAVLARTTFKYGLKGVRLALMEAGLFAQSTWILSGLMDLQGTPWAGCNEVDFYSSMNLNRHQESFLLAFLLGR